MNSFTPPRNSCLDPLNLNAVCRLCLKEDYKLIDVFDRRESSLNIPQKITELTNIPVYLTDGMSPLICTHCLKKLNKACKFRKNCIRSAEILKSAIKNDPTIKVEKYEDEDDTKWSVSDDECIKIYHQAEDHYAMQNSTAISESVEKQKKQSFDQKSNKCNERDMDADNVQNLNCNNNFEDLKKETKYCIVVQNIPDSQDIIKEDKDWLLEKDEQTNCNDSLHIVKSRKRAKAEPENCKICRRTFSSPEYLLHHMKLRHEGPDVDKYLKTHNLQKRPFVCGHCGKGFTQSTNLATHQAIHSSEKPFICAICDGTFKMKSTLRTHMKVHSNDRKYKCEICQKLFKTSSGLDIHKLRHSGVRSFSCSFCEKAFYKEYQMLNHIRIHTGEKPFSCEICGKTFSNSTNLRSHRLRHPVVRDLLKKPLKIYTRKRPKAEPAECKECQRIFKSSEFLFQHMRLRHPGSPLQDFIATHNLQVRPHVCSICGKGFSNTWYLNIHQKIHAEERTFKCHICQKAYKVATSLSHHMKSHSDERRYKCDRCPKAFKASHHLKAHIKWHLGEKEFKCVHCGKAFIKECHLQIHMRTHTGEKPYTCETCGKNFSCSSGLRTHKKIHTGEQPFSCKICNRPFSTKSSMERHHATHEVKIKKNQKLDSSKNDR